VNNNGPIHLGKDPQHTGTSCYLDDFRIYRGAIKYQVILSLSSLSMGVWGMDFTTLGCDSCNYNQVIIITSLGIE